ncbi:MAG: VanZ family protein [Bacteroidales bacterium]|nr:VanZ family protein [Bacteroidales bacterium]
MAKLFSYFVSRNARYYRNFFWIWLSLILFVSSLPDLPNPDITMSGREIRVDHLIHWFQYMTLSFLMVSWQFKKAPSLLRKIIFYTLVIGIAIAVGDEYHQLLIPGRSFTYMDMLSNSLGIITGVFLAGLLWGLVTKGELQQNGKTEL